MLEKTIYRISENDLRFPRVRARARARVCGVCMFVCARVRVICLIVCVCLTPHQLQDYKNPNPEAYIPHVPETEISILPSPTPSSAGMCNTVRITDLSFVAAQQFLP